MNILVIGAGVLGSLYAGRLAQSGQKVTVLARGKRLAELNENGILLEDQATGARSQIRVDVIDHLGVDEVYDLVLVIVRKNQVADVLPMLAANQGTPRILFMVNNAAGPFEMIQALGRERVILGFPGAGGSRSEGVVRYALSSKQKTTIGEYTGQVTPRILQIAEIFNAAGFSTRISIHMDAWLKTHVAIVSPIANALYMAGGSNYRLAKTPDGLALLVRAVREGLDVLTAMGQPITPFIYRILFWLPEPLLVALLPRLFDNATAELMMARHANIARDEMTTLYNEFLALARTTSVPTPAIETLGGYLDQAKTPASQGERKLTLHWEEVGYVVAGAAAAILATRLWKRLKRQ